MGPTVPLRRALLDHITGVEEYTPPATWYLGASTTTPGDDGSNFTEPADSAYARIAISDWNTASGSSPASTTNITADAFGPADSGMGPLTHWGLFEAASGGTPQWVGEFDDAKTLGAGDTGSVAAGAIELQLGDPDDFT